MPEARAAARERGHQVIGTEHVLLGLVASDDANLAAVALGDLGLDAATVGRLVDERGERGDAPARGHLRFGDDAKDALRITLDEALGLGHNHIGTEHIALALCSADGMAAQILADQGVTYDDLRARVLALLADRRESRGHG